MKGYFLFILTFFFSGIVYADDYLYNYRYGTGSPYGYNYDVSGTDDYGESVSGNIDIQGKYGTGIITNSDGEEVDVDVEWDGYGELIAEDADGNSYELSVD
ncbi:TPA: hypothetical protein ACHWKL_005001 [Providencia stuartii]|uniref:Uncharacterized protein n=4 Tax=Gammaproteobacteria TaxID=1236 RepID=A0AAJ1JDH8_PROST|nr:MULTISPECIES: hypothetical protein [Providencia]SST01176.1 Uncharacterised protein [Acinetobacter baumannii]AFH95989.1 hypothetical protein S70_21050 [Providencia stuartii MRSN 2154]AIN64952.1 hypothetical protein DR96_3108 [Providencia stuartii]AMG65895.1 hypothetical protein AL507_04600 [Providencia stuartii]AVE43450.1 hypothetical protein AM353_17315 [Providencia stuartii]